MASFKPFKQPYKVPEGAQGMNQWLEQVFDTVGTIL